MTKPLNLNNPRINHSCFYALSYLFSEAKYNTINLPLVHITKKATDFLSFAIDDSAENLWIGAFGMSSADLEKILTKTKSVIDEAIGNEMQIHVNAILIKPSDKPTKTEKISYQESEDMMKSDVNDSHILIFNSVDEANEYLQSTPNKIEKDITHLPSAMEFYENVIEYLNDNI